MGPLKRLLGNAGCRFHGSAGRRAAGAPRDRTAGRHGHGESCAECRDRQQRERQYLERLRAAAVPEASADLTARLLARTGKLAAERAAADPGQVARPDPARRLPALAAGAAAAALALVAGAGYFMGADATVPSDGAAAIPARPDTAGPPAAGGPLIGFGPGGEPDFTPAGTLSAGQLAAFRSQGWTGPDLHELGYHLIWARASVVSGEKVLERRLTDGRHFATVLEQHVTRPGPSPINVLTGRAAASDGFTLATTGTSPAPGPGSGELWINPAAPYRAIYQTASATYTYISELPAEQADDGLAALTRVSGDEPEPGPRDGIPERIERGLSRILQHLAP